jgi:hypothetical protein
MRQHHAFPFNPAQAQIAAGWVHQQRAGVITLKAWQGKDAARGRSFA